MPNRNAIIAPVVRIIPAVTKRGADMLREAPPEGFSIEFHGKQVARLAREEGSAGLLEILEELRKMGAPAYVEFHPETKAVSRLLIPLVTRVAGVSETKEGDIEVSLEMSSARHALGRTNPDFEELRKALREAGGSKGVTIITETDNHEIIDVRPFPPELKLPALPEAPQPPAPPKGNGFLGFFWWWPSFLCPNSVSEKTAMALFNLMSGKTCDPLTVPAPCIPFLYPDDGCWARAHEMYRLMLLQGVTPKKVWIYGSLHVETKNNPNCQVFWGWHVAPTVCVRASGFLGWFVRREKVIDPSLFSGPVTKAAWKSVQGDANAQLVGTNGSVYHRSYSGTIQYDATYADTNYYLAYYRLALKNRALSYGPPPYANCT